MSSSTAAVTPMHKGKGTILIVDDDENACIIMKEPLFQIAGYRVQDLGNAYDAIERAKENDIAAIIADVHLPGMNGIDMVRKMRDRGIGKPVLFVSNQITKDEEHAILGLEGCRFTVKPLNPLDLVRTVEDLVQSYTLTGMVFTLMRKVDDLTDIVAKIPQPGRFTVAGLFAYRTTVFLAITVCLPPAMYILDSLGLSGVVAVLRNLNEIIKEMAKH